MKKEDFLKALDHIDYDLVEEYVLEKERAVKRRKSQRNVMRMLPVAACFILLLGIGAVSLIAGMQNLGSGDSAPPDSNGETSDSPSASEQGVYTFEYDGISYRSVVADNEGDTVLLQYVGNYLGNVETENANGEVGIYRIYEYTESRDLSRILIRIGGSYYIAEKQN
ncbi:MAG: hypothetical protein ACI3XL_03880 [Eubacteriales bacterium]